jgi:hypothetical protein
VPQLKRQNEAIFAQLKSAQDIQFAKEGEVSLLRRGIDKVAYIYIQFGVLCLRR